MRKATFGSISHGTMRAEDLIPSFVYELRRLRGSIPLALWRDVRESLARVESDCGADDGFVDDTVSALMDTLQEFAPPYGYFGAHPGDGSDFGFWLSEGIADEFDDLRVDDTGEVPRAYRGEVLHVNDHGNCTLYMATSRGLPARGPNMSGASYTGFGTEYEECISAARAARLLSPFPLPRVAHETDVISNRDEYGLPRVLTIQNLGGRFVLCSAQAPRAQWADVFGAAALGGRQ